MVADLLPEAPYYLSAWLFTYLLHSTLLIGGAWFAAVGLARLACRSARTRAALPALRERLWKFALVAGLVTATLQTTLGLDPWGGRIALRSSASARVTPAPAVDAALASASSAAAILSESRASEPPAIPRAAVWVPSPAPSIGAAPPDEWLVAARAAKPPRARVHDVTDDVRLPRAAPVELAAGVTTSATAQAIDTTSASESSAPSGVTWVHVVVGVWLAGVAFGLARWTCQWNRLLREIDDRAPITGGTVWEVYQHLRTRADLRQDVRLSMARDLRAPITLGLRRLEIVLPPRVETELQRDEIAALLAHELAHARRRDPAWLSLCRFLEVVFFFQPLNRRCAQWLSDEAEYLCDDWAVVQVGERVALASCLTEIAGWIVHGPEPRLASGMAAAGTRLSMRVGRLLDEDHDPAGAPRAHWVTASLVPFAVGMAALVPRVAADEPSPLEVAATGTPVAPVEPTPAPAQVEDVARATEPAPEFAGPSTDDSPEIVRDTPAATRATPAPTALEGRAHTLTYVVDDVATFVVVGPTNAVVDAHGSSAATDGPAAAALDDEPEPTTGLDDVLDELDSELEELREELSSRTGGAALGARLSGLEQRVAAMRARARDLQERLDSAADGPATSFELEGLRGFPHSFIPTTSIDPITHQE